MTTDARFRNTLKTLLAALGVTAFGLIFTPGFYVICRWLAAFSRKAEPAAVALSTPAE
jgi:hypothetical protein